LIRIIVTISHITYIVTLVFPTAAASVKWDDELCASSNSREWLSSMFPTNALYMCGMVIRCTRAWFAHSSSDNRLRATPKQQARAAHATAIIMVTIGV
jgi:hypothetical protein